MAGSRRRSCYCKGMGATLLPTAPPFWLLKTGNFGAERPKAKKAKAKLPKTVAGVRVPKAIRSSVLLDELLNSELGQEIFAEALVAAAGAVCSVLTKKRPSADQIAQAGHAVTDKGAEVASGSKSLTRNAVDIVAEIVTDAARSVLSVSLTRADDDKTRAHAHRRSRCDLQRG